MRTSYGVGRYQAAEGDLLCRPHGAVSAGSRGVVFCSGRSSQAFAYTYDYYGEPLIRAITEQGLFVMGGDWGGGFTWGNDTAVTRVETGRAYQQTAQGVTAGKVVVVGISMGSVTALRYAMAHPTRVAALALIVPIPDLVGLYTDNIGGWQAEISTAYGGAPVSAQNPASNTGSFTGIPTRIWYSTDDATARPTPILDFADGAGADLRSLGAVGHTFLTSLDFEECAAFVKEHA